LAIGQVSGISFDGNRLAAEADRFHIALRIANCAANIVVLKPPGIAGDLDEYCFQRLSKRPLPLGITFVSHRYPLTVQTSHWQGIQLQGLGEEYRQKQHQM
jgi:hypothetical protein